MRRSIDFYRTRAAGASLVLAAALSLVIANAAGQETPAEHVFELRLAEDRLADGPSVVRVLQGDLVILRWTTDRAVELHLHGYDVSVRATPAAPAEMRLEAHATGRFAVAAHDEARDVERTILHLEVHPR